MMRWKEKEPAVPAGETAGRIPTEEEEYIEKLNTFVRQMVGSAKAGDNRNKLNSFYQAAKQHYKDKPKRGQKKKK